ncbi:MAG: ABC transporter ATP-binding protein [Burkholderiales bacterium]|nr:ABC transporter ATP-binding protein [Burkholderiales bacterium]
MNGTTALEVRGLSKRFAPRKGQTESPWILSDLSFSVADGELLTMVGPSGAGKTTLLNIICQVDAASGGEIVFRGETMQLGGALNPGLSCHIGYVTQDDNLLPWRTLIENVTFPLKVQGRLDAAALAHVSELMKTVNLAGFERYYPHEMSGGMRKRASLIRTLAYDPPIILMDEPFGAVDAQTRTQLQKDLLRLWNLGRKTIVFVTHDIGEAIALGDRVLVLSRSPSRVIAEHRISIPRPRDLSNFYALEGFADLYETVRKELL